MSMYSSRKPSIAFLAIVADVRLGANALPFWAKLWFSERIAVCYRIMLKLIFGLEAIAGVLLHWSNNLVALRMLRRADK